MEQARHALRRAVDDAGGQTAFAARLTEAAGRAVTQQHVFNWLRRSGVLPAEYVLAAEKATGISRHDFRPDIYPPPDRPARQKVGAA